MARVTVEDCIEKVESQFELVLLAAQRARNISAGSRLTVEKDNDKNTVVALREIAEETILTDDLRDGLVKNFQRHADPEEFQDDEDEMLEEIMNNYTSSSDEPSADEAESQENTEETSENQEEKPQ